MNLKKMLLLLLLVVITVKNFGQTRRVADRYFSEFSYPKSAKLYKALVQKKGDTSKHVLSRLATSYYNNSQTVQAEIWYKKLIEIHNNTIEDKYLFKYAQVLRSNGKYKKSDSIFLLLSPSDKSNRKEELENENYLSDYSNEDIKVGVRNLVINTPYSDFGGFLLNGKSYYTSAAPTGSKKERIYKWNNQPFLNVYKADEKIRSFNKNEKTLYFTRNNVKLNGKKAKKDKKNTSNLKIYKASFINGAWLNIKELPFNNDAYSIGHPALSSDEKTLYFVSNMPGGFGDADIYKVAILENNNYGKPINLGDKINTSEKEMFPFVAQDGYLYFSSNGHLGFGLLDIFQSKIIQDSIYLKAKNLGLPFNSKRDDFSFYINEDGKKGFFSSNRKEGKGDDDIYSFYMYTDSSVCTESIKGEIKETVNNTFIKGALITLINSEGKVIKETLSDTKGKYLFKNISCDEKYTVLANKLNHKSESKKQIIATKDKVSTVDLNLTPLVIGNQIVINPIYFDYATSIIREDAQYELENIVSVMINNPEVSINIESHTDSRGTKNYNRKLSDKRAKSTKKYIIERGIDKNRIISAIGYGEDKLLNKCNDFSDCSEEEHQKNRRSYFYIVKGAEVIKKRETSSKIKARKLTPKKNNFLLFLKNNFKNKHQK